MAEKRVIGIDFGTNVSAVRVKIYDSMGRFVDSKTETRALVFENGSSMAPTIARRDKQGERRWYGYDAILARRDTELVRNFKGRLEDAQSDTRAAAQELTAGYLKYLHTRFAAECSRGVFGAADAQETTYLCVPQNWSAQTKAFLRNAAGDAGFRNIRVLDDAQAQMRFMATMCADQIDKLIAPAARGYVLLADMGAQTTQLTLCAHTAGDPTGDKILSSCTGTGPNAFGGIETDALLEQYISELLAPDVRSVIVTRLHKEGAIQTWKEKSVSPILADDETIWDFEDLESLCSIMGVEKPSIELNRQTFATILQAYLMRFPRLVDDCLRAGGVEARQVDAVLLCGGHCNWYFVRDMLTGKMAQYGMPELAKIVREPQRIVSAVLQQQVAAIGAAQCVPVPPQTQQTKAAAPQPVPQTQAAPRSPQPQPIPQTQPVRPQTIPRTQQTIPQPAPQPIPYTQPGANSQNRATGRAQAGGYTQQQAQAQTQVPPYQGAQSSAGKAFKQGSHVFSEFSQKQYKLYGDKTAAEMAEYLAVQMQKRGDVTTQIVRDGKVIFLQARDKSGVWKQFLGMDRAVTVQMIDMGDSVIVTVGQGKWIDKGLVAAASLIVFWPLMLTTMVGVYGQLNLRASVLQITDEYAGR